MVTVGVTSGATLVEDQATLVEDHEATGTLPKPKYTGRMVWLFRMPCPGVKYFAFAPEPVPPDDWDLWPADDGAG